MFDIHMQGLKGRLSVDQGLGGEQFNALRQQNRRFALHLRAMLQIFNLFHALVQARPQRRQRLFGQGRTSLGRIALPSQGIGNIELASGQQALCFIGPFLRNMLLRGAALEFIELFAQRFGCALVAVRKLFEDFLHLLGRGMAR